MDMDYFNMDSGYGSCQVCGCEISVYRPRSSEEAAYIRDGLFLCKKHFDMIESDLKKVRKDE